MTTVTTAATEQRLGLKTLRPHQQVAVDAILEHLEAGRNVILDGPTGSGKSVIAAWIMALRGGRSLYMSDNVDLVHQQHRSHPSMFRVVVGHGNYCQEPWRCGNAEQTCDSCGKSEIKWLGLHLVTRHGWDYDAAADLTEGIDCDYKVSKLRAMGHPFVTMTTQYYLTDQLYVKAFGSRDLVLVDECDQLQSTADRTFGEDYSYGVLDRLGVSEQLPDRIASRGQEQVKAAARPLLQAGVRAAKARRSETLAILRGELPQQPDRRGRRRTAEQLENDAHDLAEQVKRFENGLDLLDDLETVCSPSATGFTIRFIDVAPALTEHLWQSGKVQTVVMSATPGNADVWSRTVGLDNFAVVEVPHTFPVVNRTVRLLDGPNMSKAGYNTPSKVRSLAEQILESAEGRTLVLVNSRAQAQALAEHLGDRAILHGSGQESKTWALDQLRARPDGILVSQSFWRGVDLVGDLCRTVIIAKVPWPDWGDPLVRARSDRFEDWYSAVTALKLVQGCGRAVRGQDDWARIYILDGGYRTSHGRLRTHYSRWFREAIVL